MNHIDLARAMKTPEALERFARLYGRREGGLVNQISRYTALVKRHAELFGHAGPVSLVSAPGRAEIIGNHTDHNGGKVLAAAVGLDTLAAVSARPDARVRLVSEGFEAFETDLDDLAPRRGEEGSSVSLVRGIAARMAQLGYQVGGFDAAVTSDVLVGSGLSSSAAFEVLVCTVIDSLYNGASIDGITRARIAQYAEDKYFGKPCGLMDQTASSIGGLVAIDFRSAEPEVTPLSYSFADRGYSLVVVSTGGSHGGLTGEYAAIKKEMKEVAACFGEDSLRRVRPEQLYQNISDVRAKAGDRAVLRAMHYFTENGRVARAVSALRDDDLPQFLRLIGESGDSSWELLQNISVSPRSQPLAIALALAKILLGSKGACRVHGGGFAGTTLNFVPRDMEETFIRNMESVFGERSCLVLDARPEGAAVVFSGT